MFRSRSMFSSKPHETGCVASRRAAELFVAIALAALVALGSASAAGKPGYLKHPDICGDQIVFSAEGDLWSTSVSGGEAHRLTTHPGNEVLPKFSPDGKWIAFA